MECCPGITRGKRLTQSVQIMTLSTGEADSPKLQRLLILFKKLNAIGAKPFHRADLRNHAGRHLDAALVLQRDVGADVQFARQLYGSSVLIQVGRFRVKGE